MPEGFETLAAINDQLGWPGIEQLTAPTGAGAAFLARLAREKIEMHLRAVVEPAGVRVCLLTADAAAPQTPDALALVCEFTRPVGPDALREAHRLAWNFCRVPILVTVEPHEIRVWSCLEPPRPEMEGSDLFETGHIGDASGDIRDGVVAGKAASALHWLNLVSGAFVSSHRDRFNAARRADRVLLDSLRILRGKLLSGPDALGEDIAHDLIGRLIFIQFLFDRKDQGGKAAMDPDRLATLHEEGVLSRPYGDLGSLLRDRDDAYRLFEWLDGRFNGDFFPKSTAEDPSALLTEKMKVSERHLAAFSDFLEGRILDGQYSLWRLYSFDVIPLEFVSCIYEEFLSKPGSRKGVHYTPVHLVDFLLDGVLPWDGNEWNVRVLDPACGSGVFLVRAFQRLVHRWRSAHPEARVPASVLAHLLESNLLGIDVNPRAVRIASFSLYLAMCDEIDPRDYWTEVRFPSLKDRRILATSFFNPDVKELADNAGAFDVVVGNPPWGKSSAEADSLSWAATWDWPVPNRNIGPIFIGKALRLVREGGAIALLQPVGPLLAQNSSKAVTLREKVFGDYQVDEIVNLSVLRFRLFPTANGPACIVTIRRADATGRPVRYICPKLLHTGEDEFRIVFDTSDVHQVMSRETSDPTVWSVLVGGARRDLDLVRRLSGAFPSLSSFVDGGLVAAHEGIMPGASKPVRAGLAGLRMYEAATLPEPWTALDANAVPRKAEVRAHRSTSTAAFAIPQLLVAQGWKKEIGRFAAAHVRPASDGSGVGCTQVLLSIHALPGGEDGLLERFGLMANSRLATYMLLMTSDCATERPVARAEEIYRLPVPGPGRLRHEGVTSFSELDRRVEAAFDLDEAEVALVEDALAYTIPELTRDPDMPGRRPTGGSGADAVAVYADWLLRVLEASSGFRMKPSAVIFGADAGNAGVRVVAIHLETAEGTPRVRIADGASLPDVAARSRGTSPRRTLTLFETHPGSDGKRLAMVVMVKPDEARYWTRSAALRDGDALVAGGLKISGRKGPGRRAA